MFLMMLKYNYPQEWLMNYSELESTYNFKSGRGQNSKSKPLNMKTHKNI
jgi:hypothetical protein